MVLIFLCLPMTSLKSKHKCHLPLIEYKSPLRILSNPNSWESHDPCNTSKKGQPHWKEHYGLKSTISLLLFQAAIQARFGVPAHQMRVYLHYQPSYYHLHVHFTNLRLDSPPGSDVLRAHLLDDVIENIQGDPEFYQKTTISYVLRDGDELHKWYKDAGYFGTGSSETQIADGSSGASDSNTIVVWLS